MSDQGGEDSGVSVNRGVGRPSDYTWEVAQAICEGIASGEALPEICDLPDMPSTTTVYRWLAQYPEFRDLYSRSREVQADVMFDKVAMTAKAATVETVALANLRIKALIWQAGRLSPQKYGNQVQLRHEGEVGLNVTTHNTKDRAKALAALVAKQRRNG